MAETKPGRDRPRKMNPSGRTAERWTHQVPHQEEATPCLDQDLEAGAATLYMPRLVPWAPLETMGVRDHTKTSNSLFSTSNRETKVTGRGTFLQTKTGPVPQSAREWPCLQIEVVIRGSQADPRSPLEWIDPEDKGHDPCPPRETENALCHHPQSLLGKAWHHHWESWQPLALLHFQAQALVRAQALANPAPHCPVVRSC